MTSNGTAPLISNPVDNSPDILVKVKLEKLDPEIEEKIKEITVRIKREREDAELQAGKSKNLLNGVSPRTGEEDEYENDSDSSNNSTEEGNAELEDKKSIEPVKSSNEILAELFKVFNAAPPEQILDDKSLVKKRHKHKKQKKVKKKKHKKDKSDVESLIFEINKSTDGGKLKRKKKKKHKHKVAREKDKDQDNDKDKDKNKNKEKGRTKDRDKVSRMSRDREKSKEKQAGSKEKLSRDRDRERDRDRTRDRGKSKEQERERAVDEHKRRNRDSRKRHAEDHDSAASLAKSKRSNNTKHYDYQPEREPTGWYSMGYKEHEPDGHISDISLSDEESYIQERQRHINESDHRRFEHDRSQSNGIRATGGFYSAAERTRYGSSYRNATRQQRRSPTRSRTRSRERSLGIDKKRLLEIARKNVISMFKRGNLPGCTGMSEEIKDKVLLKMRYGGRTVQDLTDFCKKISNGEHPSDLSSDEDSDVDKNGNTKAFHHPFQVKEREPIVMHIRNMTPIVPRSLREDQTKAITMQFPVSSGQQHRLTEAWVPVGSKDSLVPLPDLPAASQSTNIFKAANSSKILEKNVFEKPMPPQLEQEPAFKPFAMPSAANEAATAATNTPAPNTVASVVPLMSVLTPPPNYWPSAESSASACSTIPPANAKSTFVPDTAVPSTTGLHAASTVVFSQTLVTPLDVSSIISKRLSAMRRLQENPMDSEAIKMMYSSQKDMSSWASSKHMPGQFTGSTGVNVLKAHELNSGPQMWARRDQMTSSKPVTGGMGMQLLQKMGWKPGEGLGRGKTGSLQPLLLDVKLDKRGLVAKEDNNHKQQWGRVTLPKKQRPNDLSQAQHNVQDKHPVCLLNELTSKRKWTPPLYTLVNELGPSHNKMFTFSVSVNGETFTPKQACNTKKEAKLVAARNCLQQIGVLPP